MQKRIDSGFTLIELLVIIAIIGILSATSLATISEYRNRAYTAVGDRLFQDTRTALEAGVIDAESFSGYMSVNQSVPGPVTSASGRLLVPGLMVPQDGRIFVDYLPCVGNCLETILYARHCSAESYTRMFRYTDGLEIVTELPNWGC